MNINETKESRVGYDIEERDNRSRKRGERRDKNNISKFVKRVGHRRSRTAAKIELIKYIEFDYAAGMYEPPETLTTECKKTGDKIYIG